MSRKISFMLLAAMAFVLTSCEAIGTIFKAGMYWGFLVVALVIGLIIWLFTRSRK